MIVFDAGVLIALFDPEDPFHRVAADFVDENEDLEFLASVVTLSEFFVHPTITGVADVVEAALARLKIIDVDVVHDDILPVSEIRARTGLRMPDAVVLRTAEKLGGEIVTTDRALARAAAARGVTAHAL